MEVIKFLKSENHTEVNLRCTPNIVKIIFNNLEDIPSDEILTSGFEVLNEYSFDNQSDDYYYGYNTIYAKTETEIYLSNDGSIYEPKEEPEEVPPTEVILTLEQVIVNKVKSLSDKCQFYIINGVDVEINGDIEHFSYTNEDQINLKEIFDLAMQSQVPMYYHSDGNSCKEYSVEEIVSIYVAETTNKMHHITYFNQLKLYVESLTDIEQVNQVNYGDELTGVYLDTYNNAMIQANTGIQQILGKE